MLARKHFLTDFFFSLLPIEPSRLQKISFLAKDFIVEVETHPVNREEYGFLMRNGPLTGLEDIKIASRFNC